MKTILIGTIGLARDSMPRGLAYPLFEHLHRAAAFDVYVPAVVLVAREHPLEGLVGEIG